jgi:hypothetical protein
MLVTIERDYLFCTRAVLGIIIAYSVYYYRGSGIIHN